MTWFEHDWAPGLRNAGPKVPAQKSDPKPCELCGTPTRARCPTCRRRVCVLCTLADREHRCPSCAGGGAPAGLLAL